MADDTKQLNETFSNDLYDKLSEVKGDRTWKQAIVQEFGVADNE